MIARRYAAVPIRVSAVIAFASIVLTRSAPRNITTLLASRGPESRPNAFPPFPAKASGGGGGSFANLSRVNESRESGTS